ncbi:hypothetical protein ASF28_08845 [Methylobacterium sp. Leaf99]|uniref:hypothetical protein n=1 Tax=Methylobacterium sp. Leaf99 TaxID=1736251 RepID=UPI0006F7042B|nr:hypothetical protein [Methylobacterium sp. Leaf99]KQP11141.1 hypothetical protein ASF28_08845 [Methylobacterium sp. Leaf99]
MTGFSMLAFLVNAWTAFSPLAVVAGLGGVAALVLALLGFSWLPGFLKRPLVALGVVLLACAAVYQAGTAKGAHDAFARDAARALAAEKTRTAIARDISDRIVLQAVRDVSAARADAQKLKDLNNAIRTDPQRNRVCVPVGLARRLRNL